MPGGQTGDLFVRPELQIEQLKTMKSIRREEEYDRQTVNVQPVPRMAWGREEERVRALDLT